jgi:hypothetical protein
MKTCTRSQQSKETKEIIARAKTLVDCQISVKEVFKFIRHEYDSLASKQGFFDNLQYQKAIKSVVDYMPS